MGPETALKLAVIAALQASSAVAAIVGTRIRDRPEASISFPFLTIADLRSERIPAGCGEEHEVAVSVLAMDEGFDRARVWNAIDAVRLALDDQEPTLGGGWSYVLPLRSDAATDVMSRETPTLPAALVTFKATLGKDR